MMSGDYLAFARVPAPSRRRPALRPRRRRPPDRLEPDRHGRSVPTSGPPKPTASSRRSSSPTARPASTSALPQREKREVVLAAVAAFGFLTVRAGNRLGVIVAGGDKLIRFRPAPAASDCWRRCRRSTTRRDARHRRPRAPTSPARSPGSRRPSPAAVRSSSSRTSSNRADWTQAAAAPRPAPPGAGRSGHRPARVRAAGGRHAVGGRRRDGPAPARADQLGGPASPLRGGRRAAPGADPPVDPRRRRASGAVDRSRLARRHREVHRPPACRALPVSEPAPRRPSGRRIAQGDGRTRPVDGGGS